MPGNPFEELIPQDKNPFSELLPNAAGGEWKPSIGERAVENVKEGFRGTTTKRVMNLETSGEAELNEVATLDKYINYAREKNSPVTLPVPEFGFSQMPSAVGIPLDRLQARRDDLFAAGQRKRAPFMEEEQAARKRYETMSPWYKEDGTVGKAVHGAAALGGQLVGGLPAPENFIGLGPGKTLLGTAARGAAGGAAGNLMADPIIQGGDIKEGLQQNYDPLRTVLSTGLGAVIGGGVNAAPEAARALRGLFGQADARPPVTVNEALPTQFDFEKYGPILEANGIKPDDPRAATAIRILKAREETPKRPGVMDDTTQEARIREEVESGTRDPQQTPWAGREEPAPPPDVIYAREYPPAPEGGEARSMAYDEAQVPRWDAIAEPPRDVVDERIRRTYDEQGLDPQAVSNAFERGRLFGQGEETRAGPEARTEMVPASNSARGDARSEAYNQLRRLELTVADRERAMAEGRAGKETAATVADLKRQIDTLRQSMEGFTQRIDATNRAGRPESTTRMIRPRRAPEIPPPMGQTNRMVAGNEALPTAPDTPRVAAERAQFANERLPAEQAGSTPLPTSQLMRNGDLPPRHRTEAWPKQQTQQPVAPERSTGSPVSRGTPKDGGANADTAPVDEGKKNPKVDTTAAARNGEDLPSEAQGGASEQVQGAAERPSERARRDDGVSQEVPPRKRAGDKAATAEAEAVGGKSAATEKAPEAHLAGERDTGSPAAEAPQRTAEAAQRSEGGAADDAGAQGKAAEPAVRSEPKEVGGKTEPTLGDMPDVEAGGKTEPKLGGGTELYGGIPLKPIVDALQKIWKSSPDYVKQWAGTLSDIFGKATDKDVPLYRRVVQTFNGALRAAESEVRMLDGIYSDRKGLGGAKDALLGKEGPFGKIADMIFERPGRARSERPAFEPERRRIYNKRMSVLEEAIHALKGVDDKTVANMLDSNRLTNPTVKKLADMLKEHFDYLKENGLIDEGVKDGYFPGIPDDAKILRNEAGFLKAAERAWAMSGADNPKQAAADWLMGIKMGEAGVKKGALEFSVPSASGMPGHLKNRVLTKSARAFLRNEGWYKTSVYDVLSSYLWRTTSAAEMMRVLGKDGEHWAPIKKEILDAGHGEGLARAIHVMARVFGVQQPTPGALISGLATTNKVLVPMMLLGRATMSSVAEAAMPAIRAGKPWLAMKAIRDTARVLMKSGSMEDKVQFAKFIGAMATAMDAATLNARMSGDYTPATKKLDKVVARYFNLIGLHPWTEATKVVAVDFGRAFIADHAAHITRNSKQSKSSRLFLSELVPEKRVDDFVKWVQDVESGKVDLATAMKNKEMGDLYQRALYKFSNETILTPGRAERPSWASTPAGAIVYELSAYTQTFYKMSVGRAGTLLAQATKGDMKAADKLALAAPAIGLAMLIPMQYIQYEIRDMLFAPDNRKPMSDKDKWLRAFSGSGFLGIWDKIVNAATGVRYGNDPLTTLAGPLPATLARPVAVAMQNNSEKTNATERAQAQLFYQMVVQPSVVFLASTAPGGAVASPLAAAAVQAISSPKTREAFTSSVAGEKRQKGRKSNEAHL